MANRAHRIYTRVLMGALVSLAGVLPAQANLTGLLERAVNEGLSQAAQKLGDHLGQNNAGAGAQSFPNQCSAQYLDGAPPKIVNPRLAKSTQHLCAAGHATLHSGIARTAIYTAQYLSPGRIKAAKAVDRSDYFFEDKRIPSNQRASLADYKGSGYDRGHLAPSADMGSPASEAQSFALSNIIPQDPGNNRTVWAAVEKGVRALARHRPVYVITGPLWLERNIARIGGPHGVMVPTHLYKVVFDPAAHNEAGGASAYFIENQSDRKVKIISIEELQKLAGINFFPKRDKVSSIKLPRPRY